MNVISHHELDLIHQCVLKHMRAQRALRSHEVTSVHTEGMVNRARYRRPPRAGKKARAIGHTQFIQGALECEGAKMGGSVTEVRLDEAR